MGTESALKTRKTTRPQICLRTEKDLENLQVNLATTSSGALKLAENANIENASTPTRIFTSIHYQQLLASMTESAYLWCAQKSSVIVQPAVSYQHIIMS